MKTDFSYKLVSLRSGVENEIDQKEFDIFMEQHNIKTFYKFVNDDNKIVYKNDDWLIFETTPVEI